MLTRSVPFLVVVAVILAACTPGGSDGATTTSDDGVEGSTSSTTSENPTSTSASEPADGFGGMISVGTEMSISTLNPFAPDAFRQGLAGNAVWAMVYDIEPGTWDRVPDIVSALPSESGAIELNDDGTMTVRYAVRSEARWSDGLPISGADLAFTAEAMRDLALASSPTVDPIMATITATDSVEQLAFITFREPNLAFEDALWIILPSHVLDGVDLVNGTDGSDWPSGGPFVVDEFDPFAEVSFIRNPFYWKTDEQGRKLPYLEGLRIVESTVSGLQGDESASPVPGFLSREHDLIEVPNSLEEIGRVEGGVPDGAVVDAVPSPIIEHLTFQYGDDRAVVNDASLNDQLDYRRAVAHALDRDDLLAETGVPWFGSTPGMLIPVGPSAWDQYPYDTGVGSSLVDGLGGGGSKPSAVLSTTGNGEYRIRIGDALESRFDAIGVIYEASFQDSVLFFGEVLSQGLFDIGMWAWVSDGGYRGQLALLELFDPATTPPDGNYAMWGAGGLSDSAQRFTEIVAVARSTSDPDTFDGLVSEAEQILADQAILIPLFSRGVRTAYWGDTLSGVVANGSRSTVTWNVEMWQRAGE